jgi:hypothetical protein
VPLPLSRSLSVSFLHFPPPPPALARDTSFVSAPHPIPIPQQSQCGHCFVQCADRALTFSLSLLSLLSRSFVFSRSLVSFRGRVCFHRSAIPTVVRHCARVCLSSTLRALGQHAAYCVECCVVDRPPVSISLSILLLLSPVLCVCSSVCVSIFLISSLLLDRLHSPQPTNKQTATRILSFRYTAHPNAFTDRLCF